MNVLYLTRNMADYHGAYYQQDTIDELIEMRIQKQYPPTMNTIVEEQRIFDNDKSKKNDYDQKLMYIDKNLHLLSKIMKKLNKKLKIKE